MFSRLKYLDKFESFLSLQMYKIQHINAQSQKFYPFPTNQRKTETSNTNNKPCEILNFCIDLHILFEFNFKIYIFLENHLSFYKLWTIFINSSNSNYIYILNPMILKTIFFLYFKTKFHLKNLQFLSRRFFRFYFLTLR